VTDIPSAKTPWNLSRTKNKGEGAKDDGREGNLWLIGDRWRDWSCSRGMHDNPTIFSRAEV
jgi:hypothetical protein